MSAQPDPYLECTRCKKRIVAKTRVWLELDQRTGHYVTPGKVPQEYSQGEFPFGPDCAMHITLTQPQEGEP